MKKCSSQEREERERRPVGNVLEEEAVEMRKVINAKMDHMIPHDGSLIGQARAESSGELMDYASTQPSHGEACISNVFSFGKPVDSSKGFLTKNECMHQIVKPTFYTE